MTPLFVELCAGTAALSLRLQGGRACRPIVSRIGAKTGYADVILPCFGLTAGQRAGAYLWCEPDPGARLLLQALPQPEVLREAASVLRGWASEDPRTLWDRLRAEGPPRGLDGREVARWAQILGCSMSGLNVTRFKGWTNAAHPEYLGPATTDLYRIRYGVDAAGRVLGPTSAHPDVQNRRLLEAAALPIPAIVCDDARTVDPREVARLLLTGVWSYKQGQPATGFVGPGARRQDTTATATATATLALCASEWPPVTILDAATDPGPELPDGTVCYIDPPYEATTGYGHNLPRCEVVRLALLWAEAGAFVGVSEQCPIPELVSAGWHAVEITHGRRGQKRTFSKQQREYLTLSRPPVHPPLLGVQEVLL